MTTTQGLLIKRCQLWVPVDSNEEQYVMKNRPHGTMDTAEFKDPPSTYFASIKCRLYIYLKLKVLP